MTLRALIRPLVRDPLRLVTERRGGWSPRTLFANGEQGGWWDPSDFSTMFQDSTGTTPVTAVGQPVGLMLDKHGFLALGPELVTNGTFGVDASGWTPTNATLSVANGELVVTATAASFARAAQTITTVSGSFYKITGRATRGTSSTRARVFANGGTLIASVPGATPADFVAYIQATAATMTLFLDCDTVTIATASTFDNISAKVLVSNPFVQGTAPSRPLVQSAPSRIVYDGVDDTLVATFPVSLGAACTVARSVPGSGASILTAQTIGTTYTDNTNHCGLVIINRALTAAETTLLTNYLNARSA